MSRTSRRGDDYAPAMFPFLAVLLCTIGALVLILVVSVVHSHASAKREVDDVVQARVEKAQEESDYLQSISDELASRRQKIQQELEHRRSELANVDDHIQRLERDLEGLQMQVQAILDEKSPVEEALESRAKRIDELTKTIEAKKKELEETAEKRKNRKPAFAIIPYAGSHGTTRRPVYLECRADGVYIQPEGIQISLEDLRPPFGPGNPLDAALRVLRTAYQQRDATFGLTIPPYPLLVVRPDGIPTYALARAAMAGWDDQFGYELVEADLDLVFPPGIPSLAPALESALTRARARQESLIAAMPRHQLRSRELENLEFDALGPGKPLADGDADTSWGDEPTTPPSGTSPDARPWQMIQEMDSRQVTMASQPSPAQTASNAGTGGRENKPSSSSDPRNLSVENFGGADLRGAYQRGSGTGPTAIGGLPNASPGGSDNAFRSDGREEIRASNADAGRSDSPSTGPATLGGSAMGSGAGSQVPSQRGGSTSSGTGVSAGPSGAGGTPSNPSESASGPQLNRQDARANAFSSGTRSNSMGTGTPPPSSSSDPSQDRERQNEIPDVSVTWKQEGSEPQSRPPESEETRRQKSRGDSESRPIADARGRGWATRRDDTRATPVSRPIRIIALNDRWLIRKEGTETQFDAEIDLRGGPQQASQLLERAIRDRVDSWGLSLPGGYWSPSLTVECASDAEQSFGRLQRLLDGSGVEIRAVPLLAPPVAPIPGTPSSTRR